ncbi:MAG: NUDIX hydrolase, partial [Oscillospiraceae bacterium]
EVKFVLQNGFMEIKGSRIYLTERGSDHINGIIPLFYSDKSKEELKRAFANQHFSEKTDEELFLSAYNINNYDRPSVACDIAAFAIRTSDDDNYRKDGSAKLSLLLIKRGEHPFVNKWALPGGFLRADETVEECALREITEETNVTPSAILPVGVFSKPNRDPRGRIISNAFASIITEENVKAMGGDDAIDAKWFDVDFECGDGADILTLACGEIVLTAKLREKDRQFGETRFEIIQSDELAFDHAAIIAAALSKLRNCIGNFDIIFDFLPEKFTLASLQRVMETVGGISVLSANFRRKVSDFVEETDEFITGAGHRPAKLFKKK